MKFTENYNFNLPEKSDQFDLEHWNENTNNLDELIYQNQLGVSQNQNDILKIFNGLDTKNVNDTNSVYFKLMKLIYPVGSLYWSSQNTNPSSLFGGTWVQIKDKFILSAGDTYSNGATGGTATFTLTTANLPSHTHSFTPSGTVSSHSHGMNSHTHSFTPKGSVSSTFTGTANSHSHSALLGGTFTGSWAWDVDTSGTTRKIILAGKSRWTGSGGTGETGPSGTYYSTNSSSQKYIQDTSVKPAGTVSSTFTGTASTTGVASGNTSTATPTFTGTAGTTGATGSGTDINKMPPYVVKYCWERTA